MQDNKQPTNQSTPGALVPDIVKEIPIAAPGTALQPVDEDEELDKIMHDVGKDVKQVGQKRPKHHWFSSHKKAKAEPKFSARPIDQIKPLPPASPSKPAPVALTNQPATMPAAPVKAKPTKGDTAPFGIIILAMIVTVGLVAAAYYAYK